MTEMLETPVLGCQIDATVAEPPAVSVVVPTKDEAPNIEPLVDALTRALAGTHAEVIFVDDSDDDTGDRIRDVALVGTHPDFEIRLLERRGHQRTGGLSGAVLEGIAAARSRWVCVMDGDLQHPPDVIVDLLAATGNGEADLVIASRYQPTGSNEGLAGRARKAVSSLCTRTARLAFARRLGHVSDPMTGFFLVDRTTLDLGRLRPRGFKILLEIMISHPELARDRATVRLRSEACGREQGKRDARRHVRPPADRVANAPERASQLDLRRPRPRRHRIESRAARARAVPLPVAPDGSHRLGACRECEPSPARRIREPHLGGPRGELQGAHRLRHGARSESHARVSVTVSPFVARSPHVLYTNVVEPILRWQLVGLGHALVHAACFADGDDAFLVTALTDTGKTTTMLKVLDGSDLRFVSDDLVIMSPDGVVRSFPKPLTISVHTVHALRDTMLTLGERLALIPQSRVHSREGRRLAFWLTKHRLPVASINALIQLVIPPPKYHVQRLVRDVQSAEAAPSQGSS